MNGRERVVRQRCQCAFIGTEVRMAEHHRDSEHTASETIAWTRDRTARRARKRQRRRPEDNS